MSQLPNQGHTGVEIPGDQRRRGSGRVRIHGTAILHGLRTAGYGYSVRLHASAARKDGCHPAGGLQIITGADAGERGGQAQLGICHEGEDHFND
jgi:hypothetical protein